MNFPKDLLYSREHEWLSIQDKVATVGVSAYAIDQLGDVVHIDLAKKVGESLAEGDSFGTIESTKTVSDLYAPSSGKIIAVNSSIINSPESIAEDPYKNGWLVKIECAEKPKGLMDADSYQKYLADEEGH